MTIGFIGTGLLGQPMAQRLVDWGVQVLAYNRTRRRLTPLAEAGVQIADSPEIVVDCCEATVLLLSDAAAIRAVLLDGPVKARLLGRTIIQMGTIAPAESVAIHKEITAAGGDYLEAPVLGSIPEARAGKLVIMVGGTKDQMEKWSWLFEHWGPSPARIGPVGKAAALKLALNQLIASLTAAFSASLGMVRREDISVSLFMEILRGSALFAPAFDKKLNRMLDRDFTAPNFTTKNLLKDIKLFNHEAKALGLNTTMAEGLQSIIETALIEGHSEEDYSSIYAIIDPTDE